MPLVATLGVKGVLSPDGEVFEIVMFLAVSAVSPVGITTCGSRSHTMVKDAVVATTLAYHKIAVTVVGAALVYMVYHGLWWQGFSQRSLNHKNMFRHKTLRVGAVMARRVD